MCYLQIQRDSIYPNRNELSLTRMENIQILLFLHEYLYAFRTVIFDTQVLSSHQKSPKILALLFL